MSWPNYTLLRLQIIDLIGHKEANKTYPIVASSGSFSCEGFRDRWESLVLSRGRSETSKENGYTETLEEPFPQQIQSSSWKTASQSRRRKYTHNRILVHECDKHWTHSTSLLFFFFFCLFCPCVIHYRLSFKVRGNFSLKISSISFKVIETSSGRSLNFFPVELISV